MSSAKPEEMPEDDDDQASISSNFYFFIIILLLLFTAPPVGGAEDSDKRVLVELKRHLKSGGGTARGRYAEWNESDPSPCRWAGISCGPTGRVTGIDLSNSEISAGIFPNFSRLPELSRLDLSCNAIAGTVPAGLNRCGELRYLNLSHNLIGGELNLTGLGRLEMLDVTLNRFRGAVCWNFPATCANLVTLNLSMNGFSGDLSDCFSGCRSLRILDLNTNGFSGVLSNWFSGLREFSVSGNNLTEVIGPGIFPSGCSLEVLDLSSNGLTRYFPGSISNCSKLTYLNLWGNLFTGRVPSSIGSLPELNSLLLGNNSFNREIPEQLINCRKLVFLEISNNRFGGEIQELFGRLKTLKFLVLHSNSYTGGIESSGILALPNLVRLDLSINNFSGELPIGVTKMPKLKFLILAYNSFNGSILPELGEMSGLQAIDLSFNRLTGSIPPAIGKLKSLLWLMVADNQLTGEIPPEIGNCSSLLWLNLENNRLSGAIPPSLTDIGRDSDPTFEANRRDGAVTTGSGECLAMKRWLPATYPPYSFVYAMMTRKTCQTTWDRLLKGIGVYPVCGNSTSQVRTLAISGYLQLSGNQFSGKVPPEIGKMKNISLLHLDRNRLSGELPSEIGNLRVFVFNASNNSFSGKIPPELGGIVCLSSLDLSLNNLSGELPMSLNRLTELGKFNLSYNPLLSGVIPVTGQLSTFDNNSFIGDPLISFSPFDRENTNNSINSPPASPTTGQRRMDTLKAVTFWVSLALTVIFFACGVLSFGMSLGSRFPINAETIPGTGIADCMKMKEVGSSSVFHLGKRAFTYDDIMMATGKFSDEMVVGRGGFGVVYEGILPDGRRVAVKKMRCVDEEGEREFRAEMEALAGSGPHPNLVDLFGWCLSASEKLLVYEYMEGGSLEEVIADWSRFGWARRVEAAVGVARALVFLHHECTPAVVHRDVKASNVMIDGRGRARVTDFGLARLMGPGDSHVSTAVAGTVGYVAPEYGQTWQATTRGDVYSFGVLAMELAAGMRAVDGGELCLVDRVRKMWPAIMLSSSEEEKEVEGMHALLRVGLRCTADNPHARPDMREVLAMLLSISDGNGGSPSY